MATGYAARSAKRVGAPNAGVLQAMAAKIGRDETVCLSDAQHELGMWAAAVGASRSATARDREWAADISEALRLGAK